MPTYDYECSKGHRFEVFQKMTDEPVAECPKCGAPATRQISGGAGFLFKGEGFYITDYRSEDYKQKASAEGKGSEKASKSESDKGSKDSGKKDGGSSGGASSSSES